MPPPASFTSQAVSYEISFPWMIYFFLRLALCMKENWDLALVCTVAAGLNFYQTRARPYWHIYQASRANRK